jgi:hypothetical protein
MPSTSETVAAIAQQKQQALAALQAAREREQLLKLQLGQAVAANAVTTNIKSALAETRDAIEGLEASLPIYDRQIETAELNARSDSRSSLRDEITRIVALRREAAQEAEIAMRDLVDAVTRCAQLGSQTVGLAKQLGLAEANRLGNHTTLPMWLASSIVAVSPGGQAGWPNGASPSYAATGLPSLEEDALQREGL